MVSRKDLFEWLRAEELTQRLNRSQLPPSRYEEIREGRWADPVNGSALARQVRVQVAVLRLLAYPQCSARCPDYGGVLRCVLTEGHPDSHQSAIGICWSG